MKVGNYHQLSSACVGASYLSEICNHKLKVSNVTHDYYGLVITVTT